MSAPNVVFLRPVAPIASETSIRNFFNQVQENGQIDKRAADVVGSLEAPGSPDRRGLIGLPDEDANRKKRDLGDDSGVSNAMEDGLRTQKKEPNGVQKEKTQPEASTGSLADSISHVRFYL